MSFVGNLIGDVMGGITGAKQSAKGAQLAAQTQANAAQQAIAEQRSARDQSVTLRQPYMDAGNKALAAQMSLIGLNGTTGQQDAVNALLTTPEFTTTVRQGEEAILQNASATGGLRGGNTNNSLARFRADTLANLISNQFTRLNGLTTIGANSAAGAGTEAINVASNIGQLLGDQGAAIAGGQIAKGNVTRTTLNDAAQLAGTILGGGSGSRVRAF
ncbi:hypothetical protein GGQ80_003231 [Sphingomonas jinjuensis]|uniref:DNA transfer protein n=1 Tax=Sphingomonas jinjuensis TaxID=535907 RepID=A0A840FEN7_9SPHN|nr:hypothetical protein [Sphingomonas jinjuensis]MBB4155311.1 hypothetical protein [Sphingomonas jinjuensis]